MSRLVNIDTNLDLVHSPTGVDFSHVYEQNYNVHGNWNYTVSGDIRI